MKKVEICLDLMSIEDEIYKINFNLFKSGQSSVSCYILKILTLYSSEA